MKRDLYLALLKLRRFYGNIGKKKFRQLFRQNTLHSNALGRSFGYFLESRLDVILYRSNMFNSIFSARQAINHKKIYINGLLVTKPSFKVFINDIITISGILNFYKELKQKLDNNKILINYPNYIEVNYKLGIIVLIKMPKISDIPFPFFTNIKNITHGFIK
jgi:small subunit ribosomal protein S4